MRILLSATTFVVIGLFLASPVRGQTFDYKNTPLKSSIEKFAADNPEFFCKKEKYISHCLSKKSTYGGFEATEIMATFLNNKLSQVEINYNGLYLMVARSRSDTLLSGLTKKYGKPIKDKIPFVVGTQTDMKSYITTWLKGGDTLELMTVEGKDDGTESSLKRNGITVFVSCQDFDKEHEKLSKKSSESDM